MKINLSTETHLKRALRKRIAVPALILGLLIACAALTFAVRAYNRRAVESILPARTPAPVLSSQTGTGLQGRLNAKLSLQPQADLLRRRIGQRFLISGREIALLTGTLVVKGETHAVQVTRQRNDEGENLTIALDGQTASLTWNSQEGAKSASFPTSGDAVALIERIALDSPDQFILAQLRGASYRTIAQRAVPQGAEEIEDYTGPAWDVIRVGEPATADAAKPLSAWRLYYINSDTGLIEQIISEENGQMTTAEIGGWTEQGGELFPTQIVWSTDGQKVMELLLNNVAFSARQ
jgi:hypothetical protein